MGRHKSTNSVRNIKKRAKLGRSFDPNSQNYKAEDKQGSNQPPKFTDEDWLDRPGATASEPLTTKQKKKKGKKDSMDGAVIKNVLSKFAGQIPEEDQSMALPSNIPKLTADDWMPGCFQEGPLPRIKVEKLDAAVSSSLKKKKAQKSIQPEVKSEKLQGRQEGESYNAFQRRINKETRAKLEEQSKRVLDEGRIAKRQKRRDFLKNKKATKKESVQTKLNADDDELYRKERVAFGEVVEKPPELAVRKSLAKHKKGEKLLLGGKLGALAGAEKAKRGGGNDVADYAERIREAYRSIKKKRRQDELNER